MDTHFSSRKPPIPIDEIVEFNLGITIIPVPELWSRCQHPGFISRDLTTIRIDQAVLEKKPFLYRTTIAHEAAHSILHRDFYSQLKYADEDGWVRLVQSIDEKDFKNLEWQAVTFAGLICVPRQALKNQVATIMQGASEHLKKAGIKTSSNVLRDYVAMPLSKYFEVQPSMIKMRIDQDGLLPPSAPIVPPI